MVTAAGWVLKKPTSQGTKPWASASLQKRFLESNAFQVAYFAEETSKRAAGMKPRGTFDLRDVSMLRESQDPTAPTTALELTVKKHAFTLSFKRCACLTVAFLHGNSAILLQPRGRTP